LSTEPPVILDSDFLSSFAWVNRLDILEGLYSKQMIVLEEVLEELRRVPHLASRVRLSIRNGHIRSEAMLADSPEALQLAELLESGRYGSGEASCMAYLTQHDGILGSNNLSDVKGFCTKNKKRLLTTADVLHQAYKTGHITLDEVNKTWTKMLSKKQKLPALSFTEYLSTIDKGGNSQA
jgi:predicted nucleic acid-binding protein